MSKSNMTQKKRTWAFELYPDSMPDDAFDMIRMSGLMCACSPLHDKDLNPDGVPKKPHYHLILVYGGPTTYKNVCTFTQGLNGTIPIPLESVRGYYRYFTHLDNPDKYQYSDTEIKSFNGFSIADFIELTRSEVNSIKMKLQQLIRDMNITEYADLMDVLLDSDMSAEYDVAVNNTFFFDRYITSRRHMPMSTALDNDDNKEG